MCVFVWFCFINNIYNMASGSFVFNGGLGAGQVHLWPAEGARVSWKTCFPLCGQSSPSLVLFPRFHCSPPPSRWQLCHLPPICMAQVKLNGHPGPAHSEREDRLAWCFKPLLRERRARVYVQERREVVHVQKGVGPCIPFQGLTNRQGTENKAS